MFDRNGPMIAQEQLAQTAVDLRFGFVPLPGADRAPTRRPMQRRSPACSTPVRARRVNASW
jgi:hypothetical protein